MSNTLIDMMPSPDEMRAAALVKRALDQVGFALKDHGLFITIDTDGNYGIDRLPADIDIKGERLSDKLRRVISDSERRDAPLVSIRLSDAEARKLASEFSELEFNRPTTEAEIYRSIVAGTAKFFGLPISVYWG